MLNYKTLKLSLVVGMSALALAAIVGWTLPGSETPEELRAKFVAVLDGQKREELSRADAAEASGAAMLAESEELMVRAVGLKKEAGYAVAWSKSCRAANVLGTMDSAVDCGTLSVTDAEPVSTGSVLTGSVEQVVGQVLGTELEDAELKLEKPEQELISEVDRSDSHLAEIAKNLVWRYNAKGFSQSPVGLTASGAEARTKQLLRAYKFDERFKLTEDYGYELFKKVGKRYSIKPEMLVCVAKADSSLGRWLTTGYNIGNVGNNDRGNRVHFESIGAGVDHIGKALSNKWLGYKQSVGSLSPVGGGNAPFYSSSPEGNWYNNVRNCLAEIHDDASVGPDWMFRN